MRTIELDMTADQYRRICIVTGDARLVHNALGYLQTWNMLSYNYVSILTWVAQDSEQAEFTATYRKDRDAPIGYQIGAVWHPATQTFGFHS